MLSSALPDKEVWKKTDSEKLNIIRSIRKDIQSDWISYTENFFDDINSREEKLFIILDEVSFMIEDMKSSEGAETTREFLSVFRGIREKSKNVVFILSGSDYLPTFVESWAFINSFDDLSKFSLDLFSEDTAREFIFLVLTGKNIIITHKEITQILGLMGRAIPFFLQVFLDTIARLCRQKGSLSSEEVERLYADELLGSPCKRYFESIYRQLERYEKYGKSDRLLADSILNQLALNEHANKNELKIYCKHINHENRDFERVIDILKDDFYIKEVDDKLSFDSKLIKDWWVKHGLKIE